MTTNSNKKVSRSSDVGPWKWGREEGLIFFILVSQLVSLMGKEPSTLSLFPLSFLFSAIGSVRMGSSSSSSLVSFSNILGCSPKGSSNSQPAKKREGWMFEAVGVFGKNFPKLSLFLRGMEGNSFGLVLYYFLNLKVLAELKLFIE